MDAPNHNSVSAVVARRERARLRALPTSSSSSSSSSSSPPSSSASAAPKRAREAEAAAPRAKAAPLPPPTPPALREPLAPELASCDAVEEDRASLKAAETSFSAAEARLEADRAREHTRREAEEARLEAERAREQARRKAEQARLEAELARLGAERARLAAGRAQLARSDAAVTSALGGAEAAYARRGERFLDIIGLVAARGYAAEVSQCRVLCGLTWHRGDRGATNDMIVSSLCLQCGAGAAQEARRESFACMLPGFAKQVRPGETYLGRGLARQRATQGSARG